MYGEKMGMVLVLVIFLVIYLNLFLAQQFDEVAAMKGYPDKKYFWIAFFFGIFGYILVAALPDRNPVPYENKSISALPLKQTFQANPALNTKLSAEEDKKRLIYWTNHKEEHKALLQRKVEIARKLNSATLSAVERNTLQKTLLEVENELNRPR